MAFEFEMSGPRTRRGAAFDRHATALLQHWQRACERLEIALADAAALRARVGPDDPALVAAQLRIAEARRRRHEASERIEALDADFDA